MEVLVRALAKRLGFQVEIGVGTKKVILLFYISTDSRFTVMFDTWIDAKVFLDDFSKNKNKILNDFNRASREFKRAESR